MEKLANILMEIECIESDVRDSWLAADGGLTYAATDVLALAHNIRRKIDQKDFQWLNGCGLTDADNQAESDLLDLAYDASKLIDA